jgi:prepilin-type processing-associated H-X9-DG protein
VPQIWGGPIAWGEEKGALYKLVVTSGVLPKANEFPKVLVCPDARPRGSISYALNAVLFGYRHPSPFDDPDDPDDDEDLLAGLYVPPLQLGVAHDPAKVVALYDVRVESLARVWGGPVDNDEADISDQFTGNATHDWAGIVLPNPAGFMRQRSQRDPSIEADPPHGKAHNILFTDGHTATHTSWRPDKMTRLTGWEPNDSALY